jgi:hypothetical protein
VCVHQGVVGCKCGPAAIKSEVRACCQFRMRCIGDVGEPSTPAHQHRRALFRLLACCCWGIDGTRWLRCCCRRMGGSAKGRSQPPAARRGRHSNGKWARSNERSNQRPAPPDSRQAESSSSKRRIHFIHSLAYLIRKHALLDWGGPSTPGQPVPVGLDLCHGPFWPGSCLIDRMIPRGRGRRILFVMCTCDTSTRCPHSPIDPSHTHS